MSRPPLILALFGPPGSGKGTMAQLLTEEFALEHLATGDLLRTELKNKTPLGLEAEAVMKAGGLVSDALVQAMLSAHILAALEAGRGILLDGFPRTVPQFEFLERFLTEHGRRMDAVFNLQVRKDVLIARLTGRRVCRNCGQVYHLLNRPPKVPGVCDVCGGELYQRADDMPELIEKRMAVYEQQTRPVLEAIERLGVLIAIPADDEAALVRPRLAAAIQKLQTGAA